MASETSQSRDFYTVNVFTSEPYTGNPLAIVLDADELNDTQMQLIAREFNLAETIFVQTPEHANNTAKVRIFTPECELPFAGHPTIGCAIFLAEQENSSDSFEAHINLEEVAGLVPVHVKRSHGLSVAQLTAPVIPKPSEKIAVDSDIELNMQSAAAALGLSQSDFSLEPHAHIGGPTFIMVPVNNKAAISNTKPVALLCDQLTEAYGATGLYVYCMNNEKTEVDARMFAFAAGIPEDPATGSAAALLASQLHIDEQLQPGVNEVTIRQGVDMGRPSLMQLSISLSNGELDWVKVSGSSTPISSGQIKLPA